MLEQILVYVMVFGITYTFIAFFVERFIVFKRTSLTVSEKKFWTSSYPKDIFRELEKYKDRVKSENGSLIFYWYIYLLHKYGVIYLVLFFLLFFWAAFDMLSSIELKPIQS